MLYVAVGFILLQVALNTGLTAATVFAFKDQFASSSSEGTMISDGSGNVVATATAKVHVPLYTAPVLATGTTNLFLTIDQLEFHYELLVPDVNGDLGFTDPPTGGNMLMRVQGVQSHNMTWVDFHGENGYILRVKNGIAQFITGDGVNETYSVCAGTVACGAVAVPKDEATNLMDLADYELTSNGFALPPGADPTYTDIERRSLTETMPERHRNMAHNPDEPTTSVRRMLRRFISKEARVEGPRGKIPPKEPEDPEGPKGGICVRLPPKTNCGPFGNTLGYGCSAHTCFYGVTCNKCAENGCTSWCTYG